MKTQTIGKSKLTSTRLIYGCMRIVGTWNPAEVDAARRDKARAAVLAAWDAGYNHFDHADIYCRGACEKVFGDVLRDTPSMRRDQIVITTKCGIRWKGDPDERAPHRYDFSARHILWSCEQSLKRLQVDDIDVYLLHRPDVLMNPPEIAEAFGQLQREGKVRHFGVSNFRPDQLDALQAHLPMPLVAHQIEIHPNRLDPFVDGTLDQCQRLGITPTAWSPVWGGRFGDGAALPPQHATDERLNTLLATLDAEAAALGVGRAAVTLAWLMTHPARIQPIVGTADPRRIADAAKADTIDLSREAWYRIYLAARGKPLP